MLPSSNTSKNRFLITNPGMMTAIGTTAKESVKGQISEAIATFGLKGITPEKVELLVTTATQDSRHGERAAEVMFLLKDAYHSLKIGTAKSDSYSSLYLPAGSQSHSATLAELHDAHLRASIKKSGVEGYFKAFDLIPSIAEQTTLLESASESKDLPAMLIAYNQANRLLLTAAGLGLKGADYNGPNDTFTECAKRVFTTHLQDILRESIPDCDPSTLATISQMGHILVGLQAPPSMEKRIEIASQNLKEIATAAKNMVEFQRKLAGESEGAQFKLAHISIKDFLNPLVDEYTLRTPIRHEDLLASLKANYFDTLGLVTKAFATQDDLPKYGNLTIVPMASERHSQNALDVWKVRCDGVTVYVKHRIESDASTTLVRELTGDSGSVTLSEGAKGTVFKSFADLDERSVQDVLMDKSIDTAIKETLTKEILKMVMKYGVSDLHHENLKVVIDGDSPRITIPEDHGITFLPIDTEVMSEAFTTGTAWGLFSASNVMGSKADDFRSQLEGMVTAQYEIAKTEMGPITPLTDNERARSRVVLLNTALLADLRAKMMDPETDVSEKCKKVLRDKITINLEKEPTSYLKNAKTGLDDPTYIETIVTHMYDQLSIGVIPRTIYAPDGKIIVDRGE